MKCAAVKKLIEARLDSLDRKHHFNPADGWNQVRGKDVETICDYGAFEALSDLLDELQ